MKSLCALATVGLVGWMGLATVAWGQAPTSSPTSTGDVTPPSEVQIPPLARDDASSPPPEPTSPAALPLWEASVFAGHFNAPAYLGADSRNPTNLAVPYLTYRGERLSLDRTGGKVNAIRDGGFTLDVDAGLNFGSDASDIPERQGMPNLGTTVEVGPSAKWHFPAQNGGHFYTAVAVRASVDLSNQLSYRGLNAIPKVGYTRRFATATIVDASLGAVIGDQKYLATFYQVDAPDAQPNRPAYAAKSGLLGTRFDVTAIHPITPQMRVVGAIRYESAKGAANADSPLMKRDSSASAFVGLVYTFWASQARAKSRQ